MSQLVCKILQFKRILHSDCVAHKPDFPNMPFLQKIRRPSVLSYSSKKGTSE